MLTVADLEAAGIRIKKLFFKVTIIGQWQSVTDIGNYIIHDNGENWASDRFYVFRNGAILSRVATLDAAKTAVRADYDTRVLTLLKRIKS